MRESDGATREKRAPTSTLMALLLLLLLLFLSCDGVNGKYLFFGVFMVVGHGMVLVLQKSLDH